MGAAEHVRFAYCARRDGDCGYRGVELRVGGGEEEFVEEAAYFVCREHRNGGHLRAGGEAGVRKDGGSRRYIYNQWQLMHEFVFPARGCRREAAEKIHHVASNGRANPDIAVHNPYDIPFGFTVCPAHVPDLRIRPQIPDPAVST